MEKSLLLESIDGGWVGGREVLRKEEGRGEKSVVGYAMKNWR